MVAVEAIANNSAPIIFDPKSICGITNFVAGGYAGEIEIWEDNQTDPMKSCISAMNLISERTNGNKPRHIVISPGEWKQLKDLGLCQ